MTGAALLRGLALPFTVAPLLLVVIFAVLLRLALFAGLLGLPLLYIIGSWFLKYGFVLLEHAANGRPGAPVLSAEDVNPFGETRPFLFGLLIAVFLGISRVAGDLLGQAWASILHLAGMTVLPAVIAIHAITGSYAEALHPSRILAVIHRLGPGYLAVMLVATACAALAQWLLVDATQLAVLLRMLLLMQLWLVLFATLGSIIHLRRHELGFDAEQSPETTQRRASVQLERERNRFIDQVFAEYRAGSTQNAWESIQRRAGHGPGASTEYAWIHERVAEWSNQALANRVARAQLPLLLAKQQNGAALRLAQARLRADPQFRPATSEQTLRVAQLARDGGDWPLARRLLEDFEQRFPQDPVSGSVALLLGQLRRS
jgi:hypothetical protein